MPNPPTDRVLVTGGSGFIGSHLVSAYLADGAHVASLSRSIGRCKPHEADERFSFLECDLTDRDACVRAFDEFRPTVVLHYASQPDGPESTDHARACVLTNTVGTLNLLDAFTEDNGVFIYGDTTKVYGNEPGPYTSSTHICPNSSYAITKSAGWDLCRTVGPTRGLRVVSVRPTLIYGPGQPRNIIGYVIGELLKGARTIELQGGRQTRDPLYVSDAIDACRRAVDRADALNGESIVVGGGEEMSIADLAGLIVEIMGEPCEIVAREQAVRETEIWRSAAENDEAKTLLGWAPQVALREGIRRTIESLGSSRAGAGTRNPTTRSSL